MKTTVLPPCLTKGEPDMSTILDQSLIHLPPVYIPSRPIEDVFTTSPHALKIQKDWIFDLESDKFLQGFGKLWMYLTKHENDPKSWCCLGVAQQRINPDVYELRPCKKIQTDHSRSGEMDTNSANELMLYGQVGEFDQCFGLVTLVNNDNVIIGSFKKLVDLNDIAELSFRQIAAFIKERPWVVFSNFPKPYDLDKRVDHYSTYHVPDFTKQEI